MSSDASAGLEHAGFDRAAGPALARGEQYRPGAADPPRRNSVEPTAAYRAELAMREAKVAALERELVRRERRHERVVERYETLLAQREATDPEASREPDGGLIAAVRERLPW